MSLSTATSLQSALTQLQKQINLNTSESSVSSVKSGIEQGLHFRCGEDQLITAMTEFDAVIPMPASLTPMPLSRSWIKGLMPYQGQILVVIDLRLFAGLTPTMLTRQSQLIVINRADRHCALLVEEVLGFTHFTPSAENDAQLATHSLSPYIKSSYSENHVRISVLDIQHLIQSSALLDSAEPV